MSFLVQSLAKAESQLAQREHKRYLNSQTPICSLPPDVLSLIFILGRDMELYDQHYTDDSSSEASVAVVPFEVLVTHVSSHFRDIALETHILWSTFDTYDARTQGTLTMYLSRSGDCGLRIRISLDFLPLTSTFKDKVDVLLLHTPRCSQLTINSVRESLNYPIVRYLTERDAPILEYLSISVDDVEGPVNINADPQILRGGAPILSFVRLRGLALSLFNPPLNTVTTLHLDQTSSYPIQYSTFRQMVTASPFLANLSIYGDIVRGSAWPGATDPINLPALCALRICGIDGAVYSGLLLGITAPRLYSLVLKDVQEYDLDPLWALNTERFACLRHLTLIDCDISRIVCAEMFHVFPAITHLTISYWTKALAVLSLLIKPLRKIDDIPWPNLHTLTVLHDLDDSDPIKDIIETRRAAGRPLQRLRLLSRDPFANFSHGRWVRENIILEELVDEDQWPTAGSYFDEDDTLF